MQYASRRRKLSARKLLPGSNTFHHTFQYYPLVYYYPKERWCFRWHTHHILLINKYLQSKHQHILQNIRHVLILAMKNYLHRFDAFYELICLLNLSSV
jgi:hypothetical protein